MKSCPKFFILISSLPQSNSQSCSTIQLFLALPQSIVTQKKRKMLQQTSRQIRTSSRSGLGSVQSPLSNPPPPTSSSSSSSKRPRNPFGNPFSYSSNGSSSGWVSSDILKFGIFSRDLSPSDEDATGDELNEPILYFYPSDIAPAMRVKFMNTVLGLGAIFYLFGISFFRGALHLFLSRSFFFLVFF